VTKSFQREAFVQWLSKNKEFFLHPPVIVKNRKTSFTMRFQGISSAIECTLTNHGYMISVDHKGLCWDLIDVGDVYEQRTSSGQYFCKECIPEYKKLFPTRFALWEDHVFQPMLKWSTNNLLKTKWLCLFQTHGNGITWARMVDENNLLKEMQDETLFKAIPIMKGQVMPKKKSATIGSKKF
jgi:hypothetical protein